MHYLFVKRIHYCSTLNNSRKVYMLTGTNVKEKNTSITPCVQKGKTYQYFSSQVEMLVGYLPKWLVESTSLSAAARQRASVWLAVTSQYCR